MPKFDISPSRPSLPWNEWSSILFWKLQLNRSCCGVFRSVAYIRLNSNYITVMYLRAFKNDVMFTQICNFMELNHICLYHHSLQS